jgi:hypothetical protein
MRVQTVERMRRVFALVLHAALFVYHIDQTWPQQAVFWLRRLGGKLGLGADADNPCILLPASARSWWPGPPSATPTIILSPGPARLMGIHPVFLS